MKGWENVAIDQDPQKYYTMSNTIQIILIALGVLVIAAVWGYNFFQERKLRRAHLQHFQEKPAEPEAFPASEERKIEPKLSMNEARKKEVEEQPDPWFEAIWRIDFSKPLLFSEFPLQLLEVSPQARFFLEEESGRTIPLDQAKHEETTNLRIKVFLGALPLIKERRLASREELQVFLDAGRKIAHLASANFGHEEVESWLAKAAKLESWIQELDIEVTVYLKVTNERGIAATKVRAALESSGFRLEEDGVFHLRSDEGEIIFSAYALGTSFSRESILTQVIPGFALSMVIPLVKDPLGGYAHLLKLADRWRDPLGIEVVNEAGEKITTKEYELVRLEIERLLALMREREIEPGSKRAFRLFGS